MKSDEVSVMKPKGSQIIDCVNEYEREGGFCEDLIYNGCLRALENVGLDEIGVDEVKGPIYTFLVHWGTMGRVIHGLDEGWEHRLTKEIRDNHNTLEKFRRGKLEDFDIRKIEKDIKKCYGRFENIVGSVVATKLLHMFCPNTFPMWDTDIRWEVSNESYKRGRSRIGDSEIGYYKFVVFYSNLLEKYDNILWKLSKKYKRSKLKIVDEFLFSVAHEE